MGTHSPKISVIIPSYNRWPQISEAVDSVLEQTYANTECIVIDDGSVDSSDEKLVKKYGDKIVVIKNQKNRDKSFCRNLGVSMSDAEYICFLDSDDLLTPDSVSLRASYFLENRTFDGVVFGSSLICTKGSEKSTAINKEAGWVLTLADYLDDHSYINTNSFLLSRRNMLEFGMYKEHLSNKEDIELFIRLFCRLEFRYCGHIVARVRDVAGNRARNDYQRIIEQWDSFSRTLASDPMIVDCAGASIRKFQCAEYGEILRSLYHSGRYPEFRSIYRKGLSEDIAPRSMRFLKRYLLSYLKEWTKGKAESAARSEN